MSAHRIQYCFDPLCGWCYAAAPVVRALAEAFPQQLEMLPSGLFAEEGARPLTRQLAHHAWHHDMRIAEMTGQQFSERYHVKVLGAIGEAFDSTAMTRALTYVRAQDATLEAGVLDMLQRARYHEGMKTSDSVVVAGLVAEFMQQAGWNVMPAELAERLVADEELAWNARMRILATQKRMGEFGVSGVPALFALVGEAYTVVQGGALYQEPQGLVQALRRWFDAAPEDGSVPLQGEITEGE